jgi:hypothetical protein
MNEKSCPSCGLENAATQVYCIHCGGTLNNLPSGSANAQLPNSVAIAARRVRVDGERPSKEGRSFFSQIWGLITYVISVGLGVIIVLMLMAPPDIPLESQPIVNATSVVERVFLSSRYNPAVASQLLINTFLTSSRHLAWKPPVDFIPAPEWQEARVLLGNNSVTYSFSLLIFNYPLHFSETFRLSGTTRAWKLVPVSGTIGLITIKEAFLLPILSFLASASTATLEGKLKILENADTLEIRYGNVVFTTH